MGNYTFRNYTNKGWGTEAQKLSNESGFLGFLNGFFIPTFLERIGAWYL